MPHRIVPQRGISGIVEGNPVKVIGYTWEADVHTVQETFNRFGPEPPEGYDEAGITDREGNPPHPIFSTDEIPDDWKQVLEGNPSEITWVIKDRESQVAAADDLRRLGYMIEQGSATDQEIAEFRSLLSSVEDTIANGDWLADVNVNLNRAVAIEQRLDSGELAALTEGNPSENVPLHEQLAAAADYVDYEADVVDKAADEISDPDIAEAAEEQADAMRDAADALDEAADAARETTAEVFTETGVPQDEQTTEVTAGNPLPRKVREGELYDTIFRLKIKSEDPKYVEALKDAYDNVRNLLADKGLWLTDDEFDRLIDGNPTPGEDVEATEWRNMGANRAHDYLDAGGDPASAPDPLSGEFAGESIPEIFGSWDNATDRNVEAYEEGYWNVINAATEGNPGEPVLDAAAPPPSDPAPSADTPPESSHWYTRPLRGSRT